jgi:ABC-type dipeptide/oligopeptide/nickel transport system permease component
VCAAVKRYLLRRLLHSALTLLGITLFTFVLLRMVPGDPARLILPENAPQAEVLRMRKLLGLDEPLHVQYYLYMRDLARADFGTSFQYSVPAIELVVERLPQTIRLSLSAIALTVALAVPAGIVAAVRRQTLFDFGAMLAAIFGQSVPNFWLGLMLILLFSVNRQWLPVSGASSWLHYVLPTITLAAYLMALVARLTRSSMLEVLRQDYVRTARAKGLAQRVVLWRHALKNAAIPIVTVVGMQIGTLLGGAVVTETIFNWPGIGKLVIEAIWRRDYPIVQAVLLLSAFAFVAINLVVDLLYTYLDPRIRYQ